MSEGPTRVRRPATVVRYAKVRVTVVQGVDSGHFVDTAGASVQVGSHPDNDLVLSDDTVSRRHCQLEPTALGIRIRDPHSTNGVFLNGVQVRDGTVTGSFQLTLGDTVLTVEELGETVDREQAQVDRFGDVIGASPRMRELYADLERIAPADVSLLIEGETGTGKDLIAESAHLESPRAGGPFVVFDCGGVAPTMIESELFGHERGAFTGAHTTHAGVFEQAHGGTLFLDEVGELELSLQPKLLRVLEKRQLRRIGGTQTIAVDVRILAATNRNLRNEVERGGFRQDLYYRLAATHVAVPPLRDRMDDLELLVGHFLASERPPRSLQEIAEDVWDMFRAHHWPGNVRELRNAVQRWALTPERPLAAAPQASGPPAAGAADPFLPLREARRQATDRFEQAYLEQLLDRGEGNVTRSAAIAEVSRQMLQKLMRKHGLRSG
ncbi:MAG: sigma 54-dependent Fis family transcriptional regulator [Deltaproteobacteria bacterium]|nr:sigma 54-dependent Fis family transcriptional regulator [Deltaproteobacteria bacterium]